METYIVLVKLLCAHLCSDFFFQTDTINNGKRKPGVQGLENQLLHGLIHAGTAYIFVAEWTNWLIPVVIFVSHFIIDILKYKLNKDSLAIFLADQLAHIVVIGVLWFLLYRKEFDLACLENVCSVNVWIVGMAYLLILKPSSILLSLFLKKWTPASSNTQSLPNAGLWIGYIERILILTFVLIGNMEGVGFLLAAKSVFRFGELNKAKEIRTTEYVLIGTFASFTMAFLTGIVIKNLL